jgi:hypothetical protein
MKKCWFRTSESSQEVGNIISENWLDMGYYLIWAIEKDKYFLVEEKWITKIIL